MAKKPNRKHNARERALQALYEWQLSGNSPTAIAQHFAEEGQLTDVHNELFTAILHSVVSRCEELDALCQPLLSREMELLDPIELILLRMGSYELLAHPELPYRVVINEMVELAKIYGATDGHRFINGVLDKLAQQLRADETAFYKKDRASGS